MVQIRLTIVFDEVSLLKPAENLALFLLSEMLASSLCSFGSQASKKYYVTVSISFFDFQFNFNLSGLIGSYALVMVFINE